MALELHFHPLSSYCSSRWFAGPEQWGPDERTMGFKVGEFAPAGSGTRLTLNEQGVDLDGYDNAGQREEGTRELLDSLERELARKASEP